MSEEDELIILNLFLAEESGSTYFLENPVEARALDVYLQVAKDRRSFRLIGEDGITSLALLPNHGHRINYRSLAPEEEVRAQALVDAALRSGIIEVRGR